MRGNRPPLNQSAYPQPSGPPTQLSHCDECAALPSLRAAYYQLIAGAQSAQVRDGERWQTFAKGDAKELRLAIQRLEIRCEHNPRFGPGRAIRAGGFRRPMWGGYGGGY